MARRWIWRLSVIFGIPRLRECFLRTDLFLHDIDCQRVSFYSRKCKKVVLLSGKYFISSGSNKCVIMIQGFSRHLNKPEAGAPEIIRSLVERGFNVLVFDLRAHGASGGGRVSLGYYEVYDLLGARDFVVNEKKISPKNVGLLGISYGAMVAILSAAKGEFGALVLDSVPGDIFGYLKRKMKKFHIPIFLLDMLKALVNLFLGINVDKLNTREAAQKISAPIMFILGKKDKYLFTSSRCLYWVKIRNLRDKIWVTDASHSQSFKLCPKEYLENLIEFFQKTL